MSNHQISLRQFASVSWLIILHLLCCTVEPILTSSSNTQAVIKQLEHSLKLDQGFFKNPTREDKRAIRVLARKAKNLKRFDVFNYLKMITPPGTTG